MAVLVIGRGCEEKTALVREDDSFTFDCVSNEATLPLPTLSIDYLNPPSHTPHLVMSAGKPPWPWCWAAG